MGADDGKQDFERYAEPPPPGFNLEYAKFKLACEEARRPKPWFDGLSVTVALLASLSGAALSVFNATVYWADRRDHARKEAFDDQISVARIYFDRISGDGFCGRKEDAVLYAKVSLHMAGLDENALPEAAVPGAMPERSGGQPVVAGLQDFALLVYRDIQRRTVQNCDGPNLQVISAPARPEQAVDAVPPAPGELTSYGLKEQQATSPPPAPGGRYAVYIQYQSASGSKPRADAILAALKDDTSFRAQGAEAVRQVPNRDQIRIYKKADEQRARDLRIKLGIPGAQIISLESAYSRLPSQTIEVWLAAAPVSGG